MLFSPPLPAGVDAAVMDQCVGGFREAYGRSWNVASRPYPGIPELLDGLVTRSIGMAVLSNKPHAFTVQCVNELLPRWRFRVVLGDREGFAEPDPGEAVRIATQLDVAPEQMVYLGDSAIDMTTARRAGMIPIGEAWGFRTVDELQASGAARIITHPLELLKFLDHKAYPSWAFEAPRSLPHWRLHSVRGVGSRPSPPSQSGSKRPIPEGNCVLPGGSSDMMSQTTLI